MNFENLTVEFHSPYVLNKPIKFRSNRILFTIWSINLFFIYNFRLQKLEIITFIWWHSNWSLIFLNFVSIKDVIRTCNLTVRFSKFTLNINIYDKFVGFLSKLVWRENLFFQLHTSLIRVCFMQFSNMGKDSKLSFLTRLKRAVKNVSFLLDFKMNQMASSIGAWPCFFFELRAFNPSSTTRGRCPHRIRFHTYLIGFVLVRSRFDFLVFLCLIFWVCVWNFWVYVNFLGLYSLGFENFGCSEFS